MTFTNTWFEQSAKASWDELIPSIKPKKILEIGSYEGKSICYLIEKLGNEQDLEIHAIDSWLGGHDHISQKIGMDGVEERYLSNTKEALSRVTKNIQLYSHKDLSDIALSKLIAKREYQNYFDFIYVDGSHETTETLSDLVMAFKLLAPGGVMAIDDYLWCVGGNPDFIPKLAIDAFVNLHLSKINLVQANNSQVYIVKK